MEKIAKDSIVIRSYEELDEALKILTTENFELVVIHSSGGLGKTTHIKKALAGKTYGYFSDHMTAGELYCKGFEFKDKILWFDDVEVIQNGSTDLLKSFAETSNGEAKRIQWGSLTSNKDIQEIGDEYYTKSKVIISTNDFGRYSNHKKALFTRGILIEFRPTNQEVFNRLKTFFNDKDILDFIQEYLEIIPEFNFRDAIILRDSYKKVYENWKQVWLKHFSKMESVGNSKFHRMFLLQKETGTDISKTEKWGQIGLEVENKRWSRADYFRWKKKVMKR